MEQSEIKQPFMPTWGMAWFFTLVTLIAVVFAATRYLQGGSIIAESLMHLGMFALIFLFIASVFFFVSYFIGSTEKFLETPADQAHSPFAEGQLPKQVIPPRPIEDTQ